MCFPIQFIIYAYTKEFAVFLLHEHSDYQFLNQEDESFFRENII